MPNHVKQSPQWLLTANAFHFKTSLCSSKSHEKLILFKDVLTFLKGSSNPKFYLAGASQRMWKAHRVTRELRNISVDSKTVCAVGISWFIFPFWLLPHRQSKQQALPDVCRWAAALLADQGLTSEISLKVLSRGWPSPMPPTSKTTEASSSLTRTSLS